MTAVGSKNETVSLTDLANASGSDKGTSGHPSPHHYTRIYDMLLQPHRHSLTNMLEIGLMAGGPEVGGDVDRVVRTAPSVDMWLKFFPEAQVRGFDISDFSWVEHPRFTFVRGDSGAASDLEKAAALGPFDLIIDDGSHASFHQQLAFKVLFPKLRPGGLYIIEDLQWQSPYYEDQLPTTHKTSDVIDNWFKPANCLSSRRRSWVGCKSLAQTSRSRPCSTSLSHTGPSIRRWRSSTKAWTRRTETPLAGREL